MKKVLLAVMAVLLVAFGTLLPLLRPQPSRVTRQNFVRIKVGMSRKEVEAILGGPPGDYRTGPTVVMFTFSTGPFERWEWNGDEGTVLIHEGFRGGVGQVWFLEPVGTVPGPLDRLRWRWDRWRESLFK